MAGVQIPIEVVDKFSKQLSAMESQLGSISKTAEKQNTAFNLLSADIITRYGREALGAITDFGRESIRQFQEQEVANKRLQVAMQNLGVYTENAYQNQLALAASLQKTTTFSDDQIVQIQALLTSFGLYGAQLQRVTKSSLDLAVAQKVDLQTAALLLGKAFQGETGTLQRYGIVISDTGTRAERFEQVMAVVNRRFGGQAEAEVNTHAGAIKQLGNEYADLEKKIGALLTGNGGGFIAWGRDAIGVATFLADKINEGLNPTPMQAAVKEYEHIGEVLKSNKGGLLEWITTSEADLKILRDRNLAEFRQAELLRIIAQEQEKVNIARGIKAGTPPPPEDKQAREAAMKAEQERNDKEFALAAQAGHEIEIAGMTESQILDLKAERFAGELQLADMNEAAERVRANRVIERDRQLNQQRLMNLRSTLGNIATLSQSHNKAMAAVGKAAAIGQATIDTYVAAQVAMKSAPPPFSFALAALTVAAGLANVARIAGVELAEGGMVRARAGGVQATLAEAGRDEVAIPLDDPRTKARLADVFGGRGGAVMVKFGDINVNIQGADLGSRQGRQSAIDEFIQGLRSGAAEYIEAALLSAQLAAQHPLRAV